MYISWECQIGRDLILVVKLAGAWRNLLLGNIYKTRNRTAKFIELCDNRSSIPYTSNQLANINKKIIVASGLVSAIFCQDTWVVTFLRIGVLCLNDKA